MSALFTPGPWQVNGRDPLQICDCDGETRGCAPIADVIKTGDPKPRYVDLANAHLIAAAPDLYSRTCDQITRANP